MFVKGMIMRLLILMVLVYCYIRLASSNTSPITSFDSESVLVPIDSVSTRTKYTFVPDTIWTYHTKYGPTLYSTTNKHNVGDSILINLVTKDSHE
jgi:hypothetical protein